MCDMDVESERDYDDGEGEEDNNKDGWKLFVRYSDCWLKSYASDHCIFSAFNLLCPLTRSFQIAFKMTWSGYPDIR